MSPHRQGCIGQLRPRRFRPLAAADVGIIFRARASAEDVDDDYDGETRQRDDICRLQIVKNRWEGKGSLFLQLVGDDQFKRVSFKEWRASGGTTERRTKAQQCAEEIRHLLMDREWQSRSAIVKAMAEDGFGRNTVDQALSLLESEPDIQQRQGEKNTSMYRVVTTNADGGENDPGDDLEKYDDDQDSVSLFPSPLRQPGNRETEIPSDETRVEEDDDRPAQWRGF